MHPRLQDYTQSSLDRVIPNESELTSGALIEPGKSYGFFTDTTVCIGCKACEVACKEWNNLPADNIGLTGQSYDNTGALSANTWRHVNFIEKTGDGCGTKEGGGCGSSNGGVRDNDQPAFQSGWLMMSDVCKHCHNPPCMEACPTGALFKTEFDTVVVQQDICNGCGYCVPACPFGVVDLSALDGKAHKCTLCYDRLKGGLEPACAKSCPTDSIMFGEIGDLTVRARNRVAQLHERGVESAYLYGAPDEPGATGGLEYLNAFFLLTDRPEVYNLPVAPTRAARRVLPGLLSGFAAMTGLAVAAAVFLGGSWDAR
ncbi:4Fe-4S dicluster domain-containing protein [Lichenicoccus sp.]|uniref:4Fe-4S dicluster domain-containing protein n=1 Tax=Lichenicoccus sp. TaxID=2781899 RepID=UPI003D0D1182